MSMSVEEDYTILHSRESRSISSIEHEFTILYTTNGDEIHVFVEGDEDVFFYKPYIKAMLTNISIHQYVCGGKTQVVSVREWIRARGYDIKRCAFFVDRDYDDLLSSQIAVDDRTYITDYYSIENHVVCEDAAEFVLCDVAKIPKSHRDYMIFQRSLMEKLGHFAELIRPFISGLLLSRHLGLRPNMNNVDLAKLFAITVSGNAERRPKSFELFCKTCGITGQIRLFELRPWMRRLKLTDYKLWIRGKYEIWFFQKILLKAIQDAKSDGLQKVSCPEALKHGRLLELVGGRIQIPSTLREFLDKAFA